MDEQDDSEKLKVVDRRRFTEEGEARAGAEESAEQPSPVQEEASQPFQDSAEQAEARSAAPGADFSSFVIGLTTQALVLLGEVPNPETKQVTVNLGLAKQTIDIIGLLEEKTKGNLTEDEGRLLSEMLTNVRMAYVKASSEKKVQGS